MRKVTRNLLAVFFGSATAAFAAESTAGSGMSPLTLVFIAFFALVLAFQSIPALITLVSALRGIFSQAVHRENEAREGKKSP